MASERENIQVSEHETLVTGGAGGAGESTGLFGRAVGRVRRGAAALLRLAAGRPMDVARVGTAPIGVRARRGSFLIMVVGTLALLSVLVVIYVTVGTQDRRVAAVADRNSRIEAVIGTPKGRGPDGYVVQPDSFADYVLGVMRDDLFTMVPDRDLAADPSATNNKRPEVGTLRREMWDYPSTGFLVDSLRKPTDTLIVSPTKGKRKPGNLTDVFSPEGVGTDPWLASTRPEDMGLDKSLAGQTTNGDDLSWKRRVDWPHITNIAPDGRFVNLGNLYNNFNAPSGFGTLNVDGIERNAMSRDLSLTNLIQQLGTDQSDDTQPPRIGIHGDSGTSVRVDPLAGGSGMRRTPWQTLMQRDNALEQRPAFWDTAQIGAFRPVEGNYYGSASAVKYRNGLMDKALPSLQWADADGDGFYDARWQEIVDARLENNARSLIATDPKYRFFFATRIVDLSALINVNTAGDLFAAAPSTTGLAGDKLAERLSRAGMFPLGSSPADVDLARVLTLEDLRTVYAALNRPGNAENLSYSNLAQPATKDGGKADDYSKYDLNSETAQRVGRASYLALREALSTGTVPSADWSDTTLQPYLNASNDVDAQRAARELFFADSESRARFSLSGMTSQLVLKDNSSGGSAATNNEVRTGVLLGLDSAIELLTYRGVNDPSDNSRLEAVLAGRDKANATFSPLRSTRGLDLERRPDRLNGQAEEIGNGVMDGPAAVWNIADARQHLTTVNGARLLWSGSPDATQQQTAAQGKALSLATGSDARIALENALLDVSQLFKGVASALAPYADKKWAWTGSQADYNGWTGVPGSTRTLIDGNKLGGASAVATLAYGHGGSSTSPANPQETALIVAGMFSANAAAAMFEPRPTPIADLADKMKSPPLKPEALAFDAMAPMPTTLVLDANTVNGQPDDYPWGAGTTPSPSRVTYNGTVEDKKFTGKMAIDPTVMAQLAANVTTPGLNIYGVTAQPFVTGVMSMTAYTNTPNTAPKKPIDKDVIVNVQGQPGVKAFKQLFIDGTIHADNPDFLFRVVAFQITNPFDQAIVLGRPPQENATLVATDATGLASAKVSFTDPSSTFAAQQTTDNNSYYVALRSIKPNPSLPTNLQESDFVASDETPRFMLVALSADSPDASNRNAAKPVSDAATFNAANRNALRVQPIILQPGETAVCFATSQPPKVIIDRMKNAIVNGDFSGRGPSLDDFAAIVLKQFRAEAFEGGSRTIPANEVTKVYWVPQVDKDGKALLSDAVASPLLFNQAANTSQTQAAQRQGQPRERVTAVELWRTLITADERTADKNDFAKGNDQLVDRLRVGPASGEVDESGAATWDATKMSFADNLDRRLKPRGEILGADESKLREPQKASPTITLWSSTKRRSRAQYDPTAPNSVNSTKRIHLEEAIPDYCIEPRDRVDGFPTVNDLQMRWNAQLYDKRDSVTGDAPEFREGNEFKAYETDLNWGQFTRGVTDAPARVEYAPSVGLWWENMARRNGNAREGLDAQFGIAPSMRTKPTGYDAYRDAQTDEKYLGMPRLEARTAKGKGWTQFKEFNDEYADAARRLSLPVFNAGNRLNQNPVSMQYSTFDLTRNPKPEARPTGLRVGDLLRNLALAPYYDPAQTSGGQWLAGGGARVDSTEFKRATLSEMFAFQLGYYKTTAANATEAKDNTVLGRLSAANVENRHGVETQQHGKTVTARQEIGTTILDNGSLFLDRYVPFIDRDADFVFSPDKDTRVGLGVPAAVSIMDAFHAMPLVGGTLVSPVRGLININTASVDVLRTLPLLSPNFDDLTGQKILGGKDRSNGWMLGTDGKLPVKRYDAASGTYRLVSEDVPLTGKSDIAAMIVAYRDKRAETLRPEAAADRALEFADFGNFVKQDARTFPSDPFGLKPDVLPADVTNAMRSNKLRGRETLNLINGVNEEPGFRSIGELMCVRELKAPDKSPQEALQQNRGRVFPPEREGLRSNIDMLGYNGSLDASNKFVGVDDSVLGIAPGFIAGYNPAEADVNKQTGVNVKRTGKLANDYGERLAVMSAISNLVTVRSDVYVCWFVVAGFQKSDCVGLGTLDPLVPSIKRRFMMIVDRSNVTKPTDKPRVLVWKELPL